MIDATGSGASITRALPSFRFDPPHEVEIEEGPRESVEHVATLLCGSKDEAIESTFVRIAIACLDTTASNLTDTELEVRIDEFAWVFGALRRPARLSVEGLWGQLAIVLWSTNVRLALASWQSNADAIEALDDGKARLHVKVSGPKRREHGVRLEDLTEAPGGRTLLASLVLDEAQGGETVADLHEAILAQVEQDLDARRRLERLVTLGLGEAWRDAAERRFSLRDARRRLRFFDSRDVPGVSWPVPLGVRDVRFVVDLRDTDPLPLAAARTLGAFFRGVLPRLSDRPGPRASPRGLTRPQARGRIR
ncbi:MAG: PD-(D/E)XK motif protein [Myxococcales bacterium]|nr:PD-(D/E)XK motif protein [Myxococcales bacterium]